MSNALLVIDMQEILVGTNHAKLFAYDTDVLLRNVNRWIAEYPPQNVYYIRKVMKKNLLNRISPIQAFDGTPAADLAGALTVVSGKNFTKYGGDAFENPSLTEDLRAVGITHVDIVGVDGCGCVPLTAEGAVREGLSARILSDAVATMSPKREAKQKARVMALGVVYS
jgi:nicotinamidase-related amidase